MDTSAANLEQLLERRSRRLRGLVLALAFGCVVGLALAVLVRGFPAHVGGLASDYRVLYAAGQLVSRGQSPYSVHHLAAAEQAALAYPAHAQTATAFAYPPPTAWVLSVLARLPFWVSFGVFVGFCAAVAGLTLSLLARDLGWRHTAPLLVGVGASWIGLSGLFYGQFDALLFAALAGAMLLAWHDRPLAAGLVMGVVLLKPDLLWPAPCFMFLALWPRRDHALRFAAGFLPVLLIWLVGSYSQLPAWERALAHFGQALAAQPDLAGLPGLLAAAPPGWGWRLGLGSGPTLAVVALALLGMVVLGTWMGRSPDWRRVSPVGRISWALGLALGLWLLATPYDHSNDVLMLLPLFMLTVGRDARRVHGLGLGPAVLAIIVLLLIWPALLLPWVPGLLLLGAGLVVALWRRTDPRLTGLGAGLCLLSLSLLPAVAAFHLLHASLTAIAVALLVVEGARTCWMEVGGAGTGPAYYSEPALGGVAPPPSGG
ncbi:MAG: glycosyltransferase family 87 protein [Candidatus Dormibacteria bacterium]